MIRSSARFVLIAFLAVASLAALASAPVTGNTAGASSNARPIPELFDLPGHHFATRVVPILSKAGCNSGACHGAAIGQGGFRLSLLGYDSAHDYDSITRELGGRRIHVAAPEESLFLRKPTRQIDHEGGRRFGRNSESFRILRDWIAAGAPPGDPHLRVASIQIEPSSITLPSTNHSAQLRVTALFSDQSAADITRLALYSSNDEGIATVNPNGQITMHNRGVTAIMIRFLDHVAAAQIGVPFQDAPPHSELLPRNFIDQHVAAELRRWHIPPSPVSSDAEFLRRATLDLAGRLPTPAEVRSFLAQPANAAKRSDLIERLLRTDEFVDFWTLKFADLLLIHSKRLGEQPARAYHQWLREQIASNQPFDQIVRQLLTSTGDSSLIGPANFHRLKSDPRDMADYTARTLLGMRVACARCHNHPADRWTQDDYYSFAAFFARTSASGQDVVLKSHGDLLHPKTAQPVAPRALAASNPAPSPGADSNRLDALASWLTDPAQPWLARATVNRVWKELLGRGLIEPVDDLRPTNPPLNPVLLEALTAHFIENKFNLQHLIRAIAESHTYQLSSQRNAVNQSDERFFSRAYLKELSAQVLADAIAQALGQPDVFSGYPAGTRAVELLDPEVRSYALDVFGRCPRENNCSSASQFGGGLSQALHFINGETINAKLIDGAVHRLVQGSSPSGPLPSSPDFAKSIEQFYLSTLSRFPSSQELEHWSQWLAKSSMPLHDLEDLMWSLLNSKEFAFNH